jgi:retinol dehydrogenase 12
LGREGEKVTRTALITGATDGVGKATARRLLSDGWEVVIVGRNAGRCESTIAELGASGGHVTALVGDLTLMSEVSRVASEFLARHDRLDLLMLNANAIVQTRVMTSEGFETNFAIGHLGRALLLLRLQGVLEATPGAQVMTVVGLNAEHADLDDLMLAEGFTAQAALGRWQWCQQVFLGEINGRSPVLANIYMPGLVRTKILANEPQPMRTIVRVANLIVGISVDKAADNVFATMRTVDATAAKGETFAWRKQRKPLDLKMQPGEAERVWSLTMDLLEPYI